MMVTPIANSEWLLAIMIFWLLPGSIPHALIWQKGKRDKELQQISVGFLGFMTTITMTVGVGLLYYSVKLLYHF